MATETTTLDQAITELRSQAKVDEDAAMFERLRSLKASTRRTGHARVIVLITACIIEGMNKRGRSLGALTRLGFKHAYAATILRTGTGDDPARYFWKRDADGIYSSHPDLAETSSAASIGVKTTWPLPPSNHRMGAIAPRGLIISGRLRAEPTPTARVRTC